MWLIFPVLIMIFLILNTKVANNAMNQQVEPFFANYFASIFSIPNLDRIDKLSNSQYSRKNILVAAFKRKSCVFIEPFLAISYRSLPYYFKLLNNLNNFLASLIAQNNASTFFSIYLSPFWLYWCFRNLHAYWIALQNLSRPSKYYLSFYLSCLTTSKFCLMLLLRFYSFTDYKYNMMSFKIYHIN